MGTILRSVDSSSGGHSAPCDWASTEDSKTRSNSPVVTAKYMVQRCPKMLLSVSSTISSLPHAESGHYMAVLCIELDASKSWTHLVNYVENVLQNCRR